MRLTIEEAEGLINEQRKKIGEQSRKITELTSDAKGMYDRMGAANALLLEWRNIFSNGDERIYAGVAVQTISNIQDTLFPGDKKADPVEEAYLEMMKYAHRMPSVSQYTAAWMKWMALRVKELEDK